MSHYDDDHDPSRDILNFLASRTPDSVYWAWQTIIEYYTERQLTNHADKVTALSGLAQVAINSHGFRGGDYLAGLWRGGLVKGLLWHVRGPPEPCRYSHYQVPSWSWASINGRVRYFAEHYQFQFTEGIYISEAVYDASPLYPTGRVKSGYIACTGGLVTVRLVVRDIPDDYTSMYTGHNGHAGRAHANRLAFVNAYHGGDYKVLLDEYMNYGESANGCYCLQWAQRSILVRAGLAYGGSP